MLEISPEKYSDSFISFLLKIGLSSSLTSATLEQAFSIVNKSNTDDNQSISRQTRSVKGRAQYTLKKRLRDSSRQTIAEAMDIGDKRFRKLSHKVRETQQE